jgi:hypothetical protein
MSVRRLPLIGICLAVAFRFNDIQSREPMTVSLDFVLAVTQYRH